MRDRRQDLGVQGAISVCRLLEKSSLPADMAVTYRPILGDQRINQLLPGLDGVRRKQRAGRRRNARR